MKNKAMSLMLVFLMLNALWASGVCRCALAEGPTDPAAAGPKPLRCHHGDAQGKSPAASQEDCCGRCRIEKTAVLVKGDGLLSYTRTHDSGIVFSDFYERMNIPRFFESRGKNRVDTRFFRDVFVPSLFSRAPPQAAIPW